MALKQIEEMSLADLEALRLILRGDSVIDWHRLNLETEEEIASWLAVQELRPDDPRDRARMDALRAEAVAYLRRNFELAIPKPVENASIEELMTMASGKGHRQVCACSILKATHIMHHLDARELLFLLPMSSQDLFHLVEEKVYGVIGGMLAKRFPIVEFIGGRKNKDSLYTKLLSKSETSAAQVYDKVRFRIVTREVDDLLPVLLHLTRRLFPFSYTVPGQSVNTIFHFRSYCQQHPHLARFVGEMQGTLDDDFTPSDNTFSAESYRVMHFVVDLPVRLPDEVLQRAPREARELGPVVFVLCEFQLVDQHTEETNELGDASHAKYKERQRAAVMRRLKLGVREMREPPRPPPTSTRGRGRLRSVHARSRRRLQLDEDLQAARVVFRVAARPVVHEQHELAAGLRGDLELGADRAGPRADAHRERAEIRAGYEHRQLRRRRTTWRAVRAAASVETPAPGPAGRDRYALPDGHHEAGRSLLACVDGQRRQPGVRLVARRRRTAAARRSGLARRAGRPRLARRPSAPAGEAKRAVLSVHAARRAAREGRVVRTSRERRERQRETARPHDQAHLTR